MLNNEAKRRVNELALLDGPRIANMTVAVFLELCCEGHHDLARYRSAIEELNQRFSTNYRPGKIREWLHETGRGSGLLATCPAKYEKHMQWRILTSLVPHANDRAVISLLKILNIPHDAAEAAIVQQLQAVV